MKKKTERGREETDRKREMNTERKGETMQMGRYRKNPTHE